MTSKERVSNELCVERKFLRTKPKPSFLNFGCIFVRLFINNKDTCLLKCDTTVYPLMPHDSTCRIQVHMSNMEAMAASSIGASNMFLAQSRLKMEERVFTSSAKVVCEWLGKGEKPASG